jgi:hypothetical protein
MCSSSSVLLSNSWLPTALKSIPHNVRQSLGRTVSRSIEESDTGTRAMLSFCERCSWAFASQGRRNQLLGQDWLRFSWR